MKVSRRLPWWLALLCPPLILASLLQGAVPASALTTVTAKAAVDAGAPRREKSVPGRRLPAAARRRDREAVSSASPAAPIWPAARSATLDVTKGHTAKLSGTGLGLTTTANTAAPVAVRTYDRATARRLGALGYVFSAARSDETAPEGRPAAVPVTVTMDYASFRHAAGGDLASRLRVERLPRCVLDARPCRGRAAFVPADNDVDKGRISARVPLAGNAVYALVSTASGGSGDYRATDLKASGKWSVGPESGDFRYSYPLPLPPPPYGKAPDLSLEYSSQSVDGRTSASNNQASWVGLGWDLNPGFIERKYRACVDDGSPTLSDLCWHSPYSGAEDGAEYVISLQGTTTELIKDGNGRYHAEDDPGWKIEHTYDGANSDNSKEAWVVSTDDGTRYFFGYHEDSNWTVPVVGNDSGEPCHDAAQSLCRQTYRWNLDEIRDPDENDTRFSWTKETNYYKRFSNGDKESYDRGGYLSRVEYGMQTGEKPADRVDFTTAYRCLSDVAKQSPNCSAPTSTSDSDYPDVPVDLICTSGQDCTKNSPAFFVTRRLASITTQVWDAATSAYLQVDRIQPTYAMPDPPGATDAMLWLNYIQVQGTWAENVTLPAVDFDGAWLNNRVDYPSGDSTKAMPMRRITSIQNGLGGATDIHYGHGSAAATCPSDGSDSTWESGKHWDTNDQECFRVDYRPEGASSTVHGVFQKYLVTKLDQVDLIGGSPTRTTQYDYLGTPAWHYDDDLTTPTDQQQWADWRGYATVRQTDGSGPAGQRTVTETTHFRGMDGDKLKSGGTKNVNLTDWDGNQFADNHAKSGETLQSRHYRLNSDGSRTELASERYTYWDSGVTANGPGLHNAHMIRPYQTRARQLRSDGTWRQTGSDKDGYSTANGGLPTRTVQWGEIGTATDNTCSEITYAQNTSDWRWMLDYPETQETHNGDPDASTTQCPGPVVARTVTLYDNATAPGTSDQPIDGNPTEIRRYWNDTSHFDEKKIYDQYGRVTSDTDPLNHTTTTSYTPTSGWPVNGIRTTNPLSQSTTTYTSRAFGVVTRTIDPNGLTTTTDYDGAGRLVRVWLPTEPKPNGVDVPPPTGAVPSYQYSYRVTVDGTAPNSQPDKPTVVTARQLQSLTNATPQWLPTYTYLDGFGRTREVQAPSTARTGGRTVTVTTYDDRGLAKGTSAALYNTQAPADDPDLLLNPAPSEIPSWTEKTYDALQRETSSTLYGYGAVDRTTTTANYGDGKVVTPPRGARTAYWNDGLDRLAKVQENVPAGSDVPPSATPTTSYTYTPRGEVATITDAAGNLTSYGYDWLGHRTSTRDPDAGTSTTTYDPAGNVLTTKDAAGKTLAYTYDALNRKRTEWSGSVGDTKLAEWTYDTVPMAGQTGTPTKFVLGRPATTTRWSGGQAYRVDVTGYDLRYQVTGRTWTVPTAEGALAGSYSYGYGYDRAGHQTSMTYPAAGGLPAEKVTTGYTDTGRPDTLTGDAATYVKTSTYYGNGVLEGRSYGADGSVQRQYGYESSGAQRLSSVQSYVAGDRVQYDTYAYDDDSDLTSVTDQTQAVPQNQCYSYDGLQRLTNAWTTTAACSTGPSGADKTGTDPYRLAYSYDAVGDMTAVTDDATTRTYAYPDPGPTAVRPHAVTSVGSDTYGYDADGRLTSRSVGGTAATLAWTDNGSLASVTSAGATTSFAYNADGDRLVRRTPSGTTLYLDGMELTRTGTTVGAMRYYTAGGSVVAIRTPDTLQWLANDQQNSTQLAIDATTGKVSRQRYLPYGAHRGNTDAVPLTDRGFLGKTEDADTGLDQIGARYYDPSLGRFISPDPLYDQTMPQSLNGYTYADGNPTTFSDPTGLRKCWHDADGQTCVDTPGDKAGGGSPSSSPSSPGGSGSNVCGACDGGSPYDRMVRQDPNLRKYLSGTAALDARFLARYQAGDPLALAEMACIWSGPLRCMMPPASTGSQPSQESAPNHLRGVQKFALSALAHIRIQASGCVLVVCAGLSEQGGHYYFSYGMQLSFSEGHFWGELRRWAMHGGPARSIPGGGLTVGYATATTDQEGSYSASACAFARYGGCLSAGNRTNGGTWYYFGVGAGAGIVASPLEQTLLQH